MMYDELVILLRDFAVELRKAENALLVRDAADAIEELSKRLDESIPKGDAEIIISEVAKPRWIPVTERLPKYGTPVLVYGSRGGIFVAKYERARTEWSIDYWWKLNTSIHECNPTHWMPLPEPPKEEADV